MTVQVWICTEVAGKLTVHVSWSPTSTERVWPSLLSISFAHTAKEFWIVCSCKMLLVYIINQSSFISLPCITNLNSYQIVHVMRNVCILLSQARSISVLRYHPIWHHTSLMLQNLNWVVQNSIVKFDNRWLPNSGQISVDYNTF